MLTTANQRREEDAARAGASSIVGRGERVNRQSARLRNQHDRDHLACQPFQAVPIEWYIVDRARFYEGRADRDVHRESGI